MNETSEVQTVHIGSGHLPPVRQSLAGVAEGNANPFERMAMSLVDRGGDLAKLDQLLELQRKWEADQARKAYTSDMALFKAEPIQIIKSKAVGYETTAGDFVGYKHATVADVVDAVVPAMGRHGFSHHWDVKQDGADITVTCTITHRDGHRESVSMTAKADNSGKKNLIQQVASTVTYLQRYTLMSVTGVAARDQQEDDGRGYGDAEPEAKPEPDPQTPEQAEAARLERKRRYFAEAYAKNEDAVIQLKERMAFGDMKGAAAIWFDFSQEEQMALFLAPTKAGDLRPKCFTTEQRDTIRKQFPQYATNSAPTNKDEEE